jgi:hypothetical protein
MNQQPLDQDYQFNKPEWALLVTYNFTSDAELLMLQDTLTEAEIPNYIMDKSTGLVNPMLSGRKGAVQLYVTQDKLVEAQEIYQKTHQVSEEIYDKEEKNDNWRWARIVVRVLLAIFLLNFIAKAIFFLKDLAML